MVELLLDAWDTNITLKGILSEGKSSRLNERSILPPDIRVLGGKPKSYRYFNRVGLIS